MHPHIAPVSCPAPLPNLSRPGAITCGSTTPNPGDISPHMALPDGIWNHGEGFPSGAFAPDHGAYHDFDHASLILGVPPAASDVHSYADPNQPPLYWHPYSPTGSTPVVQRFVGYLRPRTLGPIAAAGAVDDAAFEIYAPLVRDPSKTLIVYIHTWATDGPPADSAGRPAASHTYPGYRLREGLVAKVNNSGTIFGIHRPGDGAEFVTNPPAGHQVIWAYIVPRTFGRPLSFQMQRNIQLARTIDLMLTEPAGSPFRPATFESIADQDRLNATPKIIMGGSFGGLVAQLGVLAHPEVFHGAVPSAFSASLHRTAGEQASYNQIGRVLGIWGPESSKGPWDALWWGYYLRQIGWDYFNASTTMRLRMGDAVRPMVFLIADEDTVTTGVDNVPLLKWGLPSATRGYEARGIRPGTPLVAWSIVDKRCHGEPGHFLTPILGLPSTSNVDVVNELAPYAVASWQSNPNPAPLPVRVNDGSEDPYAAFFNRGALGSTSHPSPPAGQALVLDATFRSPTQNRPALGQGTALGWDESLRTTADGKIWTVAADGVVTRFVVETVPAAGGYPAYQTLKAELQSTSLGAGAHALAIGDVDAGNSGDEVVVGTARWIHLLQASDLSVIRSTQLDFEHEQPRRLQLANLLPGTSGTKHIVFTTFYGHLMVMDHQLQVLTDLGEPGISDFVVHEGSSYASATTTSTVPITIASFRNHLANITLNVPGGGPIPNPAQLHAWTEALYGECTDLEAVTMAGTRMVAGSFTGHGSVAPPVRLFDALTLQPSTPVGYGQSLQKAAGDMVAIHGSGGNLAGFVVLQANSLYWIPAGGGAVGSVAITQFVPFANACALETVDVAAPASVGYREELLVSTVPGHVVLFTMEEMLGAMASSVVLEFDRPGENSLAFNAKPPRTNHTTAATWGLISRWYTPAGAELLPQLIAGDQCGELFEVDPTNGQVTLAADLRHPAELEAIPNSTPSLPSYGPFEIPLPAIRDLGVITESSPAVPPLFLPSFLTPERSRTPAIAQPPGVRDVWAYRTLPNQNWAKIPLAPVFNKEFLDEEYDFRPPHVPFCTGVAAFVDGGAVQAFPTNTPPPPGVGGSLLREFHYWGGSGFCDRNLIQGSVATTSAIVNSWYSTKDLSLQIPAPYGRTRAEGKDLRNLVVGGAAYSLQSLRLGRDATGSVIVAGLPGGSVTLLRPGQESDPNAPNVDFGEVLWESTDIQPVWDDGHGCMALAVRKVAGASPAAIDIFQGVTLSYPDPAVVVAGQPGHAIVGAIRWLRWQNGTMSTIAGPIFLDSPASPSQRPGVLVSGFAIGDIVDSVPGSELVVTTLAGDLFVFQLTSTSIVSPALVHTWVPGALGAFNGIVIEDTDYDFRAELFVAGSQGIWKWRQS
ncbi:MAG: hypothetical protein AB7I19_17295 [Planctomycetota bacterium]